MDIRCVVCGNMLSLPAGGEGSLACTACAFHYHYAPRYLRYGFDELLFKDFKRAYLLNKVLNNNGYLGYQFLKEGSISLPERADVQRFRDYVRARASGGKLLDVGCGILAVPGYLGFQDRSRFEFYGLDIIDDRAFDGTRIVGCSEFMPFPDATFETVVFATSMDHVCSIPRTCAETRRVLVDGGKVVVWMGDRSMSLPARLKRWVWNRLRSLKHGYSVDRYAIYPNGTVLTIPSGAVDPFHSFFETPGKTISFMKRAGLRHEDTDYRGRDEVFLTFSRPSG